MSFLAPFFLLGAVAVALPILLHLIRRTSREKFSFSSLLFLQPTPPRLTRRSRLENIWLLILRCLVIGLLAFGFARPYLQKPMAPDLSGGGARRILILLDTSASMRREGVWGAAVKKAQAVLDGASAADQVALYSFDRQMRAELTFEQWGNFPVAERAAMAGRRLMEIKPGWGATHLGNALTHAAELFEDAQGSSASRRRQIILISDLQEGSRLDGLQGYEWPRGLETVIEPVKSRRVTNAGLQLVADREEKENEKGAADAPAHIRVSNASDSKIEQFKIAWSDPKISGSNQTMDVYVPRGQSRIFSAPRMPTNAQPDQLTLTGDENDFDNRVYFIPARTEHLNILFLGADSGKDPAQILYYLERAFPETRRQTVKVTARTAKGSVRAADVDAAQLLVVGEKLPPEQADILSRFLTEGKTVLVALQSAGAAENVAGIPGLENFRAEEAPKSDYTMFGQIDFHHPLFAPFADPRFSDFTKIHFWRHRRVSAEKIPGARVVARFDDGDPALLHIPVGKGTLLVLTSSWGPADSQLALSSKFVPLLYSILDLGGNLRAPPAQYFIGDEVTVSVASPGSTAGRAVMVVRKPDGKEVAITSGDGKFTETDLPGIYQVMATQPPQRFAVNLAAEESKTGPMSIEELERLGVPLKASGTESLRQAEQKKIRAAATELESKQKLWRWLIVAALMILIVETWLAGKLTRGSGVQTEAAL